MIGRTLLVVPLLLIAGTATAQSPIVGGRQHQPTQQEIARRGLAGDSERSRWPQSETDRLYDEVMRAAAPPAQR